MTTRAQSAHKKTGLVATYWMRHQRLVSSTKTRAQSVQQRRVECLSPAGCLIGVCTPASAAPTKYQHPARTAVVLRARTLTGKPGH